LSFWFGVFCLRFLSVWGLGFRVHIVQDTMFSRNFDKAFGANSGIFLHKVQPPSFRCKGLELQVYVCVMSFEFSV
jgi:hypothetical protein